MPETIRIEQIDASDRLRPVEPDHVALIAASIEDHGLEQPIVVRPAGGGYKLTIGAHRFAAVKSLGWTELEIGKHVLVREEDDLDAKISEIDENLARHELNALDRAVFLAERKHLHDKKRLTLGKGGDRKSQKFKEQINDPSWVVGFLPSFAEDAAKRLGHSKTSINRAVSIAERLDREAMKDIRGTMVERNQQELLALVELTPERQRAAAKAVREGRAGTVAQARVVIGVDKAIANDPQARLLAQVAAALTKCEHATLVQINDLLKPLLRSRK
jgi:ParB family chromosome partitioning protein